MAKLKTFGVTETELRVLKKVLEDAQAKAYENEHRGLVVGSLDPDAALSALDALVDKVERFVRVPS